MDTAACRRWGRYGICCIVAFPLLVLLGCGGGDDGPERAEVSGKVTFEGKPIESGVIVFKPTDGGPSAGATIENGAYSIPAESGPPIGAHRVEIEARRATGEVVESKVEGESTGPSGTPTSTQAIEQYIPAEFNKESKLTADIVSGENTKDFDL